jgi:hypothetical protein
MKAGSRLIGSSLKSQAFRPVTLRHWVSAALRLEGTQCKKMGHAVAQLVEAPRYEPEGVIGIFH